MGWEFTTIWINLKGQNSWHVLCLLKQETYKRKCCWKPEYYFHVDRGDGRAGGFASKFKRHGKQCRTFQLPWEYLVVHSLFSYSNVSKLSPVQTAHFSLLHLQPSHSSLLLLVRIRAPGKLDKDICRGVSFSESGTGPSASGTLSKMQIPGPTQNHKSP